MKLQYNLPKAPMAYGDKGMQVDDLQWCLDHALNLTKRKRTAYKEPSRFGLYTQAQLAHFQTIHGIKVSGYYDNWTKAKLKEVLDAD